MIGLLGLILVSFFITSFLLVPFIDLLFYLRRRYQKNTKLPSSDVKKLSQEGVIDGTTPIHNLLLKGKDVDTPIGGGLLLIPLVIILSVGFLYFTRFRLTAEMYALYGTLLLFGFIGFLDDIKKLFVSFSGKYSGIRTRYIFLLQLLFATLISLFLFFNVGLNNIFIPVIGNVVLGWWYIPLAVFVIVGLDGLSTGLLMICLFAFLALASSSFNQNLASFTGIWIGALIAYLYFNVYPARVYLGDAGAFGFGATLAVIGLLTGKILGLGVIGGVYVVIIASSLLQLASKRFLGRKLFPVAPIHMWLKYIGWEEPKIVVRLWLAGVMFAIFGLWLALLSR
jgi:phospho-N-acetylmuramoyl-pentapeptide-transferase